MSPLVLELASAPIEAVAADLAVVAFFAEDRPLSGSAGRADWRLCGTLSHLVVAGELRGAAGEAALLPGGGGIAAPLVMALGLGPRADFDRAALERFAVEALGRARRLRVGSLALGWPSRLSVPANVQAEALLAGLGGALDPSAGPDRVRLVAGASEQAALAEALSQHRGSLPEDLVLAIPALPAAPGARSAPTAPRLVPAKPSLRVK